MSILFLDVDGVLVHDGIAVEETDGLIMLPKCEEFMGRWLMPVDPEAVERVNQIVEATGCEVVLSSTWKINPLDVVTAWFQRYGARFEIKRKTGRGGGHRGTQIHEFLQNEPQGTVFAILDDSCDMEPYMDRLVNVYHGWNNGGVLDTHVEQAIQMLQETT